jgi:hypothetical protein
MGGNYMLEKYLMKLNYQNLLIIWQTCVKLDKVFWYYSWRDNIHGSTLW